MPQRIIPISRISAGSTASQGSPPGSPTNVTSITKDGAATISFLAPSFIGSGGPISSYIVTPYIGATPQTTTTTAAGSATSITGSNGNTYLQVPATGLTNGTAYTFTVIAVSSSGQSVESAASGANTPLSGLVFGDDFNGSSGSPIDPEWWIYNRCGFIAQNEVEWYLPSQVSIDGSGNLVLTAHKASHSGPSYPSDGNTVRNQSWLSGSVQSNVRSFTPSAGNTMTFEVSWQTCADVAGGMWPSPWLEGNFYQTQWKTDPAQPGINNTNQSEIDIAEWNPSIVFTPDDYLNNAWISSSPYTANVNTAIDLSAAQHVYQALWKPGSSVTFKRDGTQTGQTTSQVPASGEQFFVLMYLQIISGSATADNFCKIDYVRIYDQNLG